MTTTILAPQGVSSRERRFAYGWDSVRPTAPRTLGRRLVLALDDDFGTQRVAPAWFPAKIRNPKESGILRCTAELTGGSTLPKIIAHGIPEGVYQLRFTPSEHVGGWKFGIHAGGGFGSPGPEILPWIDQSPGASIVSIERFGRLLQSVFTEALEEGFPSPEIAALLRANRLLSSLGGQWEAHTEIYPTADGEVCLDISAGPGSSILLLCDSRGSVLCLVNIDGDQTEKRYDADDELPDDFLNEKLDTLAATAD